jgi:hypothetical protein
LADVEILNTVPFLGHLILPLWRRQNTQAGGGAAQAESIWRFGRSPDCAKLGHCLMPFAGDTSALALLQLFESLLALIAKSRGAQLGKQPQRMWISRAIDAVLGIDRNASRRWSVSCGCHSAPGAERRTTPLSYAVSATPFSANAPVQLPWRQIADGR